MTGTDDIDHVQIVFFDQPVQVDINEIQPGRGAPMPEQTRLDVFELERGFEQGIVLQIDLPDREVICGTANMSLPLFCSRWGLGGRFISGDAAVWFTRGLVRCSFHGQRGGQLILGGRRRL